jgi:hypothetical protein
MRPDNPVRGVERFADGQRKRRLSDDEYRAIGAALSKAEKNNEIWPPAIALTRFLLLTGWRRGEALALKVSEVDLARRTATLGDSKTGRSVRPLSIEAPIYCDPFSTPAIMSLRGSSFLLPDGVAQCRAIRRCGSGLPSRPPSQTT